MDKSDPPPPQSSATNIEGSSWWSSWLNSAKEKSVSALNATKRDLSEFVSVLGTDTKAAVSGASQNIKGLLKEGEKNGSPSKPKVPPPTIEVPSAPYDRSQAQLFAVQNSTDTYLQEPNGKEPRDKYSEWRSKFSVQAHQSDISSLLVGCPHIRSLHSQLVPAKVSYETFWMRYFYKVQLLEQEEKLRAELMARASKSSEAQLQWDEEFEEVVADGLSKPDVPGHQHSESSSDSFVCVSESATNEGERGVSQEQEMWEVVGGESQDLLQSNNSKNENKEDFDIDELLTEDEPNAAAANEADKTLEDSNSDWEDWDD